jgi:hypothetical protein
MMKSHRLYKYYLCYLDYKKQLSRFSDGAHSLLKISESAFNDFTYDYENNPNFKKLIDDIHLSEVRDEKISDLLNGTNRRISDQ